MTTYMAKYLPTVERPEDNDLQDFEEVWTANLIAIRRGMLLEAQKFVEHTLFDGGGTLAAHGETRSPERGKNEGAPRSSPWLA